MKKKHTIYTENSVDRETGEITPKRWITRQVKDEAQFIKMYLDDLGVLTKCSNTEKNIVINLLPYVDYSTNELVLTASRRKELALKIESTAGTINVCIMRLFQKNIFIRNEGKILLNPKLFFRGDELSRSKLLELTIQYELIEQLETEEEIKERKHKAMLSKQNSHEKRKGERIHTEE